jgi:hypothetical protein
MLTVKIKQMGDVIGLVWIDEAGVIGHEGAGQLVETYTTAPFVMERGEYVLRQVKDGGAHLTKEDGEAFLRALPWSLGLSGSTYAEIA